MFNKFKKLNLLLLISPELLLVILTNIFFFFKKNLFILFMIISIVVGILYLILFILISKILKSIDEHNVKVLGDNPDKKSLIPLSVRQMSDLVKGRGVKDPDSDYIITMSDIKEVK